MCDWLKVTEKDSGEVKYVNASQIRYIAPHKKDGSTGSFDGCYIQFGDYDGMCVRETIEQILINNT